MQMVVEGARAEGRAAEAEVSVESSRGEPPGELRETLRFQRSTALPGVELRVFEDSARLWRCVSSGYELFGPRTWHADVVVLRREYDLAPGGLLCSRPGEAYSTVRVRRAGSGSALLLEPEVFEGYLAEAGLTPKRVLLPRVARTTGELAARWGELERSLGAHATCLELESHLSELMALVLGGLAGHERPHGMASGRSLADRVRERLHFDDAERLDLQTLAAATGQSRFQVLRLFKRAYGMTPHEYQLCRRVGLAQQALRAGATPVDAAAQFGFTDQSHLGRHFKRLLGITPGQYRSGGAPPLGT